LTCDGDAAPEAQVARRVGRHVVIRLSARGIPSGDGAANGEAASQDHLRDFDIEQIGRMERLTTGE
jgi:hypothetical protein